MKNKIEILSPGKNCRKTQKIITKIEKLIKDKNINVKFLILSNYNQMLDFETWILPTVIINGKIVARGYVPNDKKIFENLNL